MKQNVSTIFLVRPNQSSVNRIVLMVTILTQQNLVATLADQLRQGEQEEYRLLKENPVVGFRTGEK